LGDYGEPEPNCSAIQLARQSAQNTTAGLVGPAITIRIQLEIYCCHLALNSGARVATMRRMHLR
jgi:hypothetical protein